MAISQRSKWRFLQTLLDRIFSLQGANTHMSSCRLRNDGSLLRRCDGERGKFQRNRQIAYTADAVQTDGKGNIVARPPTKRLPCFADPVEYLRGLSDTPFIIFNSHDGTVDYNPKGCFKCGVRDACHRVVEERLASIPNLLTLRQTWEIQTKPIAGEDAYRHPSYKALVQAIEQEGWNDSNEDALEEEADRKREQRATDARKGRRAVKPQPRKVTNAMAQMIDAECDRHKAELRELADPSSAPLWLRNRSADRIDLIADAWRVQRLILEENGKGSGREVADRLLAEGVVVAPIPKRFVKLVEEALRRAASLWEHFDNEAICLRKYGHGMHPSVVHTMLEDEFVDGGLRQ